ncbi:Putative type IV secretion system protein IcmE/DotG [Pseudomonas luteola]|uniref:DotG/IcmE/VirB10 family protein n=1 Tax=Pseudomonas luteola TaxID=47886 RepID=A0A2X2C392_PSELU|nr:MULTISPECIES: DotG/IcmE/VirB10 family protein [Pseudomonas]MBA1250181.1 hypothetical protein [Pseudomonas zeshuii]MBH3440932.1 DotG/IcmE/VirB10 family protein [Pseudomonas luteola]SPY99966.1 Putative type IV secretion system protein IcmE/DotG [Pseudomonas luteola]
MGSNDITNDDLELSIDPEDRTSRSAYSDTISVAPAGAGLKSIFASANRKRLIFISCIGFLVLVAIVYTFTSFEPSDVQGSAGSVRSPGMMTQKNNNPSAVQTSEANQYNNETLKEVQRTNPSAHPVLVTEPEQNNPVFKESPTFSKPEKISDIGRPNYHEELHDNYGNNNQQNANNVRVASSTTEYDELIKDLIRSEGENTPQLYTVDWKYNGQVVETKTRQSVSSHESTNLDLAEPENKLCSNPAARAASMYMATTDLALNSDVGGPVSITIQNGRLRGSKLLGTFERKEQWVRIDLNKMATKTHTLPIKAIGLDLDTTLNAVQGEVDEHLLYRYGWWGVGTVLSAIGSAAEKNADSNIIITDGSVIKSMQADSSRELKSALGELGSEIGSVMKERINRPITVSLKVNDELGVFFLDDVCLPTK